MNNILIRILIFIISSLSVIALLYYQIKAIHLQQIILLLIVVLVVILRTLKQSIGKQAIVDSLLILIITFFVQLLIASTGAIFSPFLVLIHLYAIGLSLIFDFWTALSFLGIAVIVLFLQIKLDRNLFYLVSQDFGSALLYFSSILIVAPISKFVSAQYHIKGDTLKSLSKELSAQQFIVEGIEDFVFTTDTNLVVLSINSSAEKIVELSKKDILITDLIELKDEKGRRLTKESLLASLLPLMQWAKSNLNLIIKGYTLKIPKRRTPIKVIIKINLLLNQEGSLEKIIFLISQTDDQSNADTLSNELQTAHRKYLAALDLKRKDSYEKDILIASQLSSSKTFSQMEAADIFRIFVHIFEQYQSRRQNIEYKLNLPDSLQEEYRFKLANNKTPEYLAAPSSVSATTDPRLLQILIEKSIDIATAIPLEINKETLNQKKPTVDLELAPFKDYIKLTIQTKIDPKLKEIIQGFLDVNNGNFRAIDNLALSSNLEGYIIKNITNLLGVTFIAEYNQYNNQFSFNISINKRA